MDESSLGSCPMAGFGVSGAEKRLLKIFVKAVERL
jgi:hypothetical protein